MRVIGQWDNDKHDTGKDFQMLGHWNLPFLEAVENSETITIWMNLDKLVEEERHMPQSSVPWTANEPPDM